MAANSSITDIAEPKPALIFIPDISGFTQFVTYTEISHSKHIIEELLEIIIDANQIGLEVSEIEGDAILFYRFGKAPDAEDVLRQVQNMFTNFHLHLKKYESHRVCNCGACRTGSNLNIKFIAHYGEITMNTIREHRKLFGKEVIVAHRLLKNDIDSHEYSLFTDELKNASGTWENLTDKAWSPIEIAEQIYDSGKVRFSYLSLEPLIHQLPEIAPEDYALQGGKSKMIVTDVTIDAPIDLVFNVISDVAWRSKWIPGTMEVVTDINSQLVQKGQTHKCITNGPVMVGHDYHKENEVITFSETDSKKSYSVTYTLKALSDHQTQITATLFLPKNALKELMFRWMMKKKIIHGFESSWINLKKYCEGLYQRGEQHPYSILFEEKEILVTT